MRKILRASVLLLALTGAVYAGEIPNPAPQPPATATEQTTDGEIPNPKPTAAKIVLTLLETVLAVL